MSQKEEILELIKDGISYDQIEQTTGAARGYIRQVASDHRQRDKTAAISKETHESKETSEGAEEGTQMKGESLEIEGKKKPEKKWDAPGDKTGLEHHKEWVAAKKYECNCGCTLNKKGDFCPHCGTPLDWSGVD